MQQNCTLNNDDSDSATKSPIGTRRRTNTASSRNSTASSSNNNNNNSGGQHSNKSNSSLQRRYQQHHHLHNHQGSSSSFHQRDTHSSSDDLMLYDKSFRNAMIQDVLQFKKQLLRLRKILQETETLNPFENDNGQLFTSCGLDSKLLDDIDLASLTSSLTDDPVQELSDLRRQGQVDDRDRTIRLQKNLIEKLEAEKHKEPHNGFASKIAKECVTTATQTERTRPFSIGTEGLSRLQQYGDQNDTSVRQHQQHVPTKDQRCAANNQTRRHTIISTTLTNCNHQMSSQNQLSSRRASIAWENQTMAGYKPVKITLIGDPLKQWNSSCNTSNISSNCNEDHTLHIANQQDLKKNLKSSIRQQHDHQHQPTTQNGHNSIMHPQQLQDMVKVNDTKGQSMPPHRSHHLFHYQPHQHQHNNLKPTVTIV